MEHLFYNSKSNLLYKYEPETFTPKDLKTGMFGVLSNGKWFVVVNDIIVYQERGWNFISSFDKNLRLPTGVYIKKVYKNCNAFDIAKSNTSTQVYPVPLPKLTLSQIKDMIGFDFELVNE